MNWKKLSPWNWFKKESQQIERPGTSLPVTRNSVEHPMARMHREVDRLFEDLFRGFGIPDWHMGSPMFPAGSGVGALLRPQLDIAENEKGYTVTVEVPGVDRDDVDVSVDDGALLIRGEKRQSSEDESGDYHAIERSYGRFQRVLDLPDDADEENISARFKDGVLTVHVPRSASAGRRGRRIEVQG